jgi:glycosyltransferase involved in cell wall biosynthesis
MLGWEFPPRICGGLGVACHGLARALARRVDLILTVPHGAGTGTSGWVELPGLTPYLEPGEVGAAGDGSLYGGDLGGRVGRFAAAVVAAAPTRGFDIVHAHDWMTFPAGLALREQNGVPLVVHFHSLAYDREGPDSRSLSFEIERGAVSRADLVVAVSRYTAEICRCQYGGDAARCEVVHNAAGLRPGRRQTSCRPSARNPTVLFLGRLTRQKNPLAFVDIAALVLRSVPRARFVVAGDGDLREMAVERAARLGIDRRFRFTGFLDRAAVRKVLASADVLCMPSVSEPFGIAALEAAQVGLPVVVSEQSGVTEVITRARTADCHDTAGFATHLVALLTDRVAWRAESRAAAADAARWTWSHAAQRLSGFYRRVLSDRGR